MRLRDLYKNFGNNPVIVLPDPVIKSRDFLPTLNILTTDFKEIKKRPTKKKHI